MIIAISIMPKDKKTYFPMLEDKVSNQNQNQAEDFTNEILGNKDDLVSFSIKPGQNVSGKMTISGEISGGYFFEGSLPVYILDANKNRTKFGPGHATATSEWMTNGPVSFAADFDFNSMPNGVAYIELLEDDPRDEIERGNDPIKQILIPIVIENSSTQTSVYKNHGFTIELPNGYIPKEEKAEGGPAYMITLPSNSGINYITDTSFWDKYTIPEYKYIKDEKIGETIFKLYNNGNTIIYYFKQGEVGYEFYGDKEILKTFRFIGWTQ